MKSIPSLNETPFADLMLHPEKLAAALEAAKRENDAFANSRRFSRGDFAVAGQRTSFENGDAHPTRARCPAERSH